MAISLSFISAEHNTSNDKMVNIAVHMHNDEAGNFKYCLHSSIGITSLDGMVSYKLSSRI